MTDKLPSARFRRQLKDQLPLLQSEGLISPQQTQALSDRYRLTALGSEATNTLLMTIYTIGSVLIGVGVISFVAAHWDDIGRDTKIITLVSIMLAAHIAGFYLWQLRGSYPKLGHTLVLLGTLIFGANIGLFAQIFHISGNPANVFMAWSIGAIILAYAVKSIPNAVLAIVTAIIALFAGATHFHWFILMWFPPAAIILFVPFVYYSKSRWMLYASAILITLVFPITFANTGGDGGHTSDEYGFVTGFILAGVMMFIWGTGSLSIPSRKFITHGAWTFGIIAVSITLYLCSFHDFCNDLTPHWQTSFLNTCAIFFWAGVFFNTIMFWTWSLPKAGKTVILFLQIVVMAGLLLVAGLSWFINPYTMALFANLLLILLIILLFYAAFAYEDRRVFWAAVLMAALLILSRTLEYETELLIKAVIFTACGVGLIVAGVLFERFLKSRRAAQ